MNKASSLSCRTFELSRVACKSHFLLDICYNLLYIIKLNYLFELDCVVVYDYEKVSDTYNVL